MRKTITISIIILISCALSLFASSEQHSEPYPFYLLGHVSEDVQFEMDFSNSILPFDLTSNDVKYNATNQRDNLNKPLEVRGLYVGNFSLSSNTPTFTIYISHTPLKITGGSDSIDYRYYIQLGSTYGYTVKSCISSYETLDNPGGLPATENAGLIIIKGTDPYFSNTWGSGGNNQISIINTGVYVSLEDKGNGQVADAASTDAVVQALPAGSYSSNVYLLLVKDS